MFNIILLLINILTSQTFHSNLNIITEDSNEYIDENQAATNTSSNAQTEHNNVIEFNSNDDLRMIISETPLVNDNLRHNVTYNYSPLKPTNIYYKISKYALNFSNTAAIVFFIFSCLSFDFIYLYIVIVAMIISIILLFINDYFYY